MTPVTKLCCALLLTFAANAVLAAGSKLTIMTINLYGVGMNENRPLEETLAIFRAVDADIVALGETMRESVPCLEDYCPPVGPSMAPILARELGYNFYDQVGEDKGLWANAVLSRYPIVSVTPQELGVEVRVHDQKILLINTHGNDFSYPPYLLAGIPYGDTPFPKNAAEAIELSHRVRDVELERILQDIASVPDAQAILMFGDFNEPSHRDWTQRTFDVGRHPAVVEWPFTKSLEERGFTDAYRAIYPDEMTRPGYTWTPITEPDDPADHHDRIDFIFVRGAVEVLDAKVVGEKTPEADIVVTPWPTDHRAVMAVVRLTGADQMTDDE